MPPFLQYLNGIRTANNDAHSDPNDLEFLCFDVEEPVRVYLLRQRFLLILSPFQSTGLIWRSRYVLYDARAYDQPQWLKNKFVDRHTEVIENTNEPALPYYELYSAPFEAGEVCLGGNDADGKSRNILAPWVVTL